MEHPFNLIVTHLPGRPMARDAERHLVWLLPGIRIVYREPNIILASHPDPRDAVARLRRSLPRDTPILRVVPLDEVTGTSVSEVRGAVHRLLARAPEGSYAIRLDGHLEDGEGRRMHKIDAIRIIAEGVERPVNLDNPDVLVYIKVVRFRRGYVAGIYVGPPSGILSVVKERGV